MASTCLGQNQAQPQHGEEWQDPNGKNPYTLVASLFLVAMPEAPSSFVLLVVRPVAPRLYTPGKYHRTDFCFEGHLTWNTVTGEFLGKHTATFWLVIV